MLTRRFFALDLHFPIRDSKDHTERRIEISLLGSPRLLEGVCLQRNVFAAHGRKSSGQTAGSESKVSLIPQRHAVRIAQWKASGQTLHSQASISWIL